MALTCITCRVEVRQNPEGKWVVFGTGTPADGTTACSDGTSEGTHVPRCWNDWCVSNWHKGDAHVDRTGHSWREGMVLDTAPVFESTRVNGFSADGLWVTAFNADGMEVELTVRGFTPLALANWLNGKA